VIVIPKRSKKKSEFKDKAADSLKAELRGRVKTLKKTKRSFPRLGVPRTNVSRQ